MIEKINLTRGLVYDILEGHTEKTYEYMKIFRLTNENPCNINDLQRGRIGAYESNSLDRALRV